MAYCAAADVRALIKGLTTSDMSDADILSIHIARADSIIDAKISGKYTVPVSPAPAILKTLSSDIAAFFVLRTVYTGDAQNINHWITAFKDAEKTLDMIATGKIPIIDAAGAEIAQGEHPLSSNTKDYSSTFDMDAIEDSEVSSDRLDDISGDRN